MSMKNALALHHWKNFGNGITSITNVGMDVM